MRFDVRWRLQTLWVLVLVLLVSPATAQDKSDKKDEKKKAEPEYFELMKAFADTFEQVERNYVKDIDRRKLLEAALRGMLLELDPYSSYISPEELARFNQSVEQEFGGIGIQVQNDPRTGRIIVISPLPGTPAYKAGVRAGDIIMNIEGNTTENMPLSRAVQLMQGPAGAKVKVAIRHMGEAADQELELTRETIRVKSVLGDSYKSDGSWEFFIDSPNKIAYVRLTQFGRHSGEELGEVLKQLTTDGMKGLVLDLRSNPGGLLSQAVEISDLFIESGDIVSTQGKNTPKKPFKATKDGTFSGFPMAILVNRFSASASEIVSACLQDHKRAIVVGERSWGKGSVQNVIALEAGSSALKLTTAAYIRPSGKNIHRFPDSKESDEWGVMPDAGYESKFTTQDFREYEEYRRTRDVLRQDGPPASNYQDKQLNKALEYLRGAISGAGAKPEEKKAAAGETPAAASKNA